MDKNEKTRARLLAHCRTYPKLQITDVFKYIHHSAFGCEHLAPSREAVTEYIQKEYDTLKSISEAKIEELDGEFCRVPLSYIPLGLSVETLGSIFYESSKEQKENVCELERRLSVALELAREGALPFEEKEFSAAVVSWRKSGYPAIHHSEIFRREYSPAYRVISKKYLPFLSLFCEIDRRLSDGSLTVAVDGRCASGKSTLGDMLEKIYGCNIFHMDDFFLRPEQRTPERYAEVGGNIDRERFLFEALLPLGEGKSLSYRKFDCSTQELAPPVTVEEKKLTVIEGSYSMHPELSPYYDLSVFLDISPELQKKRIEKRNTPEMAERFFSTWIPLEEKYFEGMSVRDRCDLVISVE